MPRVDLQCTPRHLFRATVLPVLFEAESIHSKNACIARRRRAPLRQYLSNAVSKHAPQAETEIERVRNDEREYVTWKIDNDGAVTLDGERMIANKPGAGRRSVAAREMVDVRAKGFDCGYTFRQLGPGGAIVISHDNCRAKAVPEDEFRIVRKHPIYIAGVISAAAEESLKKLFATFCGVSEAFSTQEFFGVRSYRHHESRKDLPTATHCGGDLWRRTLCATLMRSLIQSRPPLNDRYA
jgi:hypothetical protein